MGKTGVIIVYGSYGYTGKLIVEECRARGLNTILAGRSKEKLHKQSRETGFLYEVVEVTDSVALNNLLCKGELVIHCAGPFAFTAKLMIEACLQSKTHYTDITGEYQVFELLAGYNERAKHAGITILPGTGFDVVPSDCLAVHLRNRLPSATQLQLAFAMSGSGLSRGTARTSIEGLGRGSMIRHNGELVSIALGEKVIDVDFGSFKSKAMSIPWGDISTAWRSTGIPSIEVYMGVSKKMVRAAKWSTWIGWLFRKRWVKDYLQRQIDKRPAGPTKERIVNSRSFLWGKVRDERGIECSATIETINGYALTAKASVLIAEKILRGNYETGYQTPATMFGPDLILEIESTTRIDH